MQDEACASAIFKRVDWTKLDGKRGTIRVGETCGLMHVVIVCDDGEIYTTRFGISNPRNDVEPDDA